jgi:trehalose-phosphatase
LEIALTLLARQPRLLVACDFDGTLAPLVPRPERARLPDATRTALANLVHSPGVRVAVVSSRGLRDLARRVGMTGVWLAGSSGLETRTARGVVRRYGEDVPVSLRGELRRWCAHHPGTWLEVKPRSLAVHHRSLAPRKRAAFVAGVRRHTRAIAPGWRVIAATHACEVLPAAGRDKAVVLAEWSRGLPRGRVLWLGDDAQDEPAHAWVRRRGGITVAIGRRPSAARHRLRSPRDVARLLTGFARVRATAVTGSSAGARTGPKGLSADARLPVRRRGRAARPRRRGRRA